MIIYSIPIMTISANEATPSSFITLGKGEYRVDFELSEGGSASITPKQTTNPRNSSALQEVTVDGTALVATSSTSFIVAGPVFIGAIVTGLSGTIKVSANQQD